MIHIKNIKSHTIHLYQPRYAKDLAHLKFDNSARYDIPQ